MQEALVTREYSFNVSKLRMIIIRRCHCSRIKQVALVFILISVVYYISIHINKSKSQYEAEYIGPECVLPQIDSYSKEAAKKYEVRKQIPEIICYGEDWVKCYHSKCKVVDNRLNLMTDIKCIYQDIIYKSDKEYVFGKPTLIKDHEEYTLVNSDHVKVECDGLFEDGKAWNWTYYCTGFRDLVKLKSSSLGRQNNLNVLILMFDSTSRIGFIRNLPKTYEYLIKTLNGTVLNGYNIVGDGTSGALFPILSGHTEYELPNVRKDSKNNRTLDSFPFIFYKLKEEGYRTAYLEDMPWIGTFQYKYNGFLHQPTDHYLRPFFMEEALVTYRAWLPQRTDRFCVGDTPQYQLMLNLTDQFLLLDGMRFCLTVISDLSHTNLNMLSVADNSVLNFLRTLSERNQFQNTLVLVMANHGPTFSKYRDTIQGRLEERLPFVCIVLPELLKMSRPDAQDALEINANRWTTPFDVHTTILDALNMPEHTNPYKVPDANIPRALSFLKPIPKNRSCWDAGIEPHWCTCLSWRNMSIDNPFYQKAANNVVRYINLLTDSVRNKCAVRIITNIVWVRRYRANRQMLDDGFVKFEKDNYNVRIVTGPGSAIYEASMTYVFETKRFLLDTRNIVRINSSGNESRCISNERPNLNMFCYCVVENHT